MKLLLKILIYISMISGFYLVFPIILGIKALRMIEHPTNKEEYDKTSIITLIFVNVLAGILMILDEDNITYEDQEFVNSDENNQDEAGYSSLTRSNNSLAKSLVRDAKNYDVQKVERNAKISKIITSVIIYIFLFLLAIAVLFPFYFMLISSVKTFKEFSEPTPTLIPRTWVFKNYVDAFTTANLGHLFINTVYVGLISTLLSLVITVITAFVFARLEFKGRDSMFAFLLATMMIPGELFTITNYATVRGLDWDNTFTALIVPFLVSVFYIYLLRQNFKQIPNELYLAAKVDGKSDMEYLLKVMVPLALPSLISITILKMMGAWNSYVWPNLVAGDDAHLLVTNGLRNAFTTADGSTDIPVQMAAVAIVSAPLFVVFICLRKYIMKGVSRSGIKG